MARRRAMVAALRSAQVRSGARLSHHASYRSVMASRSCGLTVRALPLASSWMVVLRAPRARAMRAEPWPMTCRARNRSRVPPASTLPAGMRSPRMTGPSAQWVWGTGAAWLVGVLEEEVVVFMSVDLGLVVGLVGVGAAGAAGGVQGPGDLGVGQAGLAGGVGERAQVGGGVGVQGAVGGPEQAGVAVAFGLGGDPAGQVGDVVARGTGLRQGGLALGLQQPGDGGPVQVGLAAGLADELVGLAVDLGGRGQDVTALRAEVQVVRWQVAVVLAGAGEVGVQAAAGGAHVEGRAV